MNYNQFISPEGPQIKIQTKSTLPQLYDPFMRRYHIHNILARSTQVFLAAWCFRLIAENAMRRSFKSFGIWVQAGLALYYANNQIEQKFYIAAMKAKSTVRQLEKSYERQHYKDSQFWH